LAGGEAAIAKIEDAAEAQRHREKEAKKQGAEKHLYERRA
jgi:hypothetical protein